MCAIGHYLESAGVATTSISLIREHAQAMRPPRSLWVPFALGRPLGAPNDAAFQRRVISAAFALLTREHGPVLEDFPEDPPADSVDEGSAWVCPVSFSRSDESELDAVVRAEIDRLAPWYELSLRRRGRTTVGVSGVSLQQALALVVRCWRAEESVDDPDGRTLRNAIEDLKVYYQESIIAQPGAGMSAEAVADVLWNETALSELLRELALRGASSVNAAVRHVTSDTLVPRSQQCPREAN